MKRAIFTAVIYTVLGILAAIAILAILTLAQAIPNILEWVAGYIGTLPTYLLLVLLIIGLVVAAKR